MINTTVSGLILKYITTKSPLFVGSHFSFSNSKFSHFFSPAFYHTQSLRANGVVFNNFLESAVVIHKKSSSIMLIYFDTRIIGDKDDAYFDNCGFYKIQSRMYSGGISIFIRDNSQNHFIKISNSVFIRCEKLKGDVDFSTTYLAGGIAADGGFLIIDNVCCKKCTGDSSDYSKHRAAHLLYYTNGNFSNLLVTQCPHVNAPNSALSSHCIKQRGTETSIENMNVTTNNALVSATSPRDQMRFLHTKSPDDEHECTASFRYLYIVNNNYYDNLYSDNIKECHRLTIEENSSLSEILVVSPKFGENLMTDINLINIVKRKATDPKKIFRLETRNSKDLSAMLYIKGIYVQLDTISIQWSEATVRFHDFHYLQYLPRSMSPYATLTDENGIFNKTAFPSTQILGPDKVKGACKVTLVSGLSDDEDDIKKTGLELNLASKLFIVAGCIGFVCLITIPTLCHLRHNKIRRDNEEKERIDSEENRKTIFDNILETPV